MSWRNTLWIIFGSVVVAQKENGIADMKVVCSEDAIAANIITVQPFRGTVYVRGHHDMEHCRTDFYANELNSATFSIRLNDCGMTRKRQFNPHGVRYVVSVIVNFRPPFLTKTDRTYSLRCFYGEAEKIMHANLNINPMPTEVVEQATTILPNCGYSVRVGSLDGPAVSDAVIGSTLVHRWQCNNPKYGMLVKNCFVTDGAGLSIPILDERGCPVTDLGIIHQVVYDTELNLAYTAIEAFNLPDRMSVNFRCQIAVCSKRDSDCLGFTPPNCPRIGREDFHPNSVVDINAVPTQVVGTMQGSLRSNQVEMMAPMIGDRDNRIIMPTLIVPEDNGAMPWRREQNTLEDVPTTYERTSTESTTQPGTTHQVTDVWSTDGPHDDVPIEIFNHKRRRNESLPVEKLRSFERTRRLADQVMDVESRLIYIKPPREFVDGNTVFSDEKAEAVETIEENETLSLEQEKRRSKGIFLEWEAVYLLGLTLFLTAFFIVVFVIWQCCQCRNKNGVQKSTSFLRSASSTGHVVGPSPAIRREELAQCGSVYAPSSRASVVSNEVDVPVYTRRLGQTNYILPVRQY